MHDAFQSVYHQARKNSGAETNTGEAGRVSILCSCIRTRVVHPSQQKISARKAKSKARDDVDEVVTRLGGRSRTAEGEAQMRPSRPVPMV